MASCFIIMPLTTPDALVQRYGQDPNHFAHVLEHLFVPALKRADFDPIKPIAQGADVIHAEIVKNLETADLVLCDISSLNPNVFFELGCRTALNKPVCYVMDDLTRAIPFDTGIINHHTYSHTLAPWTLEDEIEQLSDHVRASAERSAGKNMLWQYFGLQSVARALRTDGDKEDRLDYVVMQVDAIKQHLEEQANAATKLPLNDQPLYATAWQQAKTGFEPTFDGGPINYFTPLPPDWDKVIKNSEYDLEQMTRLQKPNKTRLDTGHVKGIIEEHIRSLSELIGSEPDSERAAKARALQLRLRALLAGR